MTVLQVDPGGEIFISFAKKKLREWHQWMITTGVYNLDRVIEVSDGSRIYVSALYLGNEQFRDSIRVVVPAGFEFLVLLSYMAEGPPTDEQRQTVSEGTIFLPDIEVEVPVIENEDSGIALGGGGMYIVEGSSIVFYTDADLVDYFGAGTVVTEASGNTWDLVISAAATEIPTTELWALERDPVSEMYIAKKTGTWLPVANPWAYPSVADFSVTSVTRDQDHGASAWGGSPMSLRRGVGSSPPDERPVFFGVSLLRSPAPNAVMTYQNALIGPAFLRRLGNHEDTSFSITEFLDRAKAVFPVADGWLYTSGAKLVAVADNTLLAVIRPVFANFGGFPIPAARALYAERIGYTVDPDTDVVAFGAPEVLKTDETWLQGGSTRVGEKYYGNSFSTFVYVYRAQIGELEWSKFTLTDSAYSGSMQTTEPSIPRPYNGVFMGLPLAVWVGPPTVPSKIEFAGVTVHDEVSPAGFPFFCNVFPVPIRIEDDQYWWINAQAVKSSERQNPSEPPGVYEYMSPHEYRYRTMLVQNGALVLDRTDSRNYTAYTDYPQEDEPSPTDSWDSTSPVYIYVPTDGVRISGVDWFCGIRVEQIFTTFSTIGVKSLQFKTRPAVWTADLSIVHTYADFEVHTTPTVQNYGAGQYTFSGSNDGGQQNDPKAYFFGRYQNKKFFVFFNAAQTQAWGVGMDAPTEAPVKIVDEADIVGSAIAIRTNPTVPQPLL